MSNLQTLWQPSLGSWFSQNQLNFRVWAPQRTKVEAVIERPGTSAWVLPLTKQSDGTFTGHTDSVKSGDLYRYRLDDKNMYPDPASRFQPQGVHGHSQVVDFRSFQWTDDSWEGIALENLVIYELHVGTFTPEGTYEAAIQKIPYLVELGITAIELMPLGDFAGLHNWGYDGVALYAPARCYGSPDELRQLVNAAHRAGLAVLLDVVYNHLGPDGNYTGEYSPFYTTDHHYSPWGKALNFDGENNTFVREFFIQNALHWVHEYHFDGLRLDATHAIQDTSPNHFLAELTSRVQSSAHDRIIHVIAEDNRNLATLIKPVENSGYGLTGAWSDDFHHQVRRFFAGDKDGYFIDFSDRLEELLPTLLRGWFYAGQQSPFFKAPHGSDPSGIPLERFVFFIQNHDQIGNRALGDRLHHQITPPAYRAASALFLSLPQTPLLFMGQEWAASSPFQYFTDHDEELGKAVTEGRKKEFSAFSTFQSSLSLPDPQSPDTFRRSKLVWDETMQEPHESSYLFYQALLELRKREFLHPSDAKHFTAAVVSPQALLLKRESLTGERILIVIQMKGAGTVDLTTHPSLKTTSSTWKVLLTSEDKTYAPDPMPPVVHLSADAPVIEFARPGAVFLKEHIKTSAHD